MINILITGGCGFIGSNFINCHLKKYENVKIVNLDCLNYCASEDNVLLKKNYIFVKGDICDKSLVSKLLVEHDVAIIIHFAAQTHVDTSFDNCQQYITDNISGTNTLLECSRDYGKISVFVHFSTDEVYGEVPLGHPGCQETDPLNPTNPYAATKTAAEYLVKTYHNCFKLNYLIIRCHNVYGLRQYPEKLIPKFIKLLLEGKKCPIQGSGLQQRKFVHTDDVSSALDLLLKSKVKNEIVNIGSINEYSVLDIVKILVKEIHGVDSISGYIYSIEDRPFNDSRYNTDSSKLKKYGWKEKVLFLDGIRDIIRYERSKLIVS